MFAVILPFDEAAKLFYQLGEGSSPDHGSLPVAVYECLLSQESSVKYRWFSWPTIFTLAQTMEFRHRTKDLRSQDCDQ